MGTTPGINAMLFSKANQFRTIISNQPLSARVISTTTKDRVGEFFRRFLLPFRHSDRIRQNSLAMGRVSSQMTLLGNHFIYVRTSQKKELLFTFRISSVSLFYQFLQSSQQYMSVSTKNHWEKNGQFQIAVFTLQSVSVSFSSEPPMLSPKVASETPECITQHTSDLPSLSMDKVGWCSGTKASTYLEHGVISL